MYAFHGGSRIFQLVDCYLRCIKDWEFNVVIDILSQGDQHTPLLITRAGQHIKYVEHMRAYSVLCTATSPIEVICPSSLLYYEPFTAVIHDAEVIIKPRVDLYSVLED